MLQPLQGTNFRDVYNFVSSYMYLQEVDDFHEYYRTNKGNFYSAPRIINEIIERHNEMLIKNNSSIISIYDLDLNERSKERILQHIFPYFEKMYGIVLSRPWSSSTLYQITASNEEASNFQYWEKAVVHRLSPLPNLKHKQ